jgi:hypothetical protein
MLNGLSVLGQDAENFKCAVSRTGDKVLTACYLSFELMICVLFRLLSDLLHDSAALCDGLFWFLPLAGISWRAAGWACWACGVGLHHVRSCHTRLASTGYQVIRAGQMSGKNLKTFILMSFS